MPLYLPPATSVSGANPSASVGLTAVNGSASTYLRSDGAPALDVSIAPTWTGNHVFAKEDPTITLRDSTNAAFTTVLQEADQHFSLTTASGNITLTSGDGYIILNNTNGVRNDNWGVLKSGAWLLNSGQAITWSSAATWYDAAADVGVKRAAAGVVCVTNGSSGTGWVQNSAGSSRVASDVTNATTTMGSITGLSATLVAGRKYAGKLVLFVNDSVAADGVKVDFDGGGATMTSFRAHGTIFDTALLLSAQTSAIATDFAVATITGDGRVEIDFGFVCNAAGTFIPRAAQNAHTTGTLTVYANSYMLIEDVP